MESWILVQNFQRQMPWLSWDQVKKQLLDRKVQRDSNDEKQVDSEAVDLGDLGPHSAIEDEWNSSRRRIYKKIRVNECESSASVTTFPADRTSLE